ncbi:hypothetical protein [Cobetia sp. MC34]|uniref:hypothetical protein n=1 Tax=Cobetia sp. MC34 TaxID=2785080 RepID=UPI001BCA414F|nr:hypothetical protein [Cobetia sp. MC34]MBS4155514.1 hypothetical protein [Cobetia sp. MC34]
MLDDIISVTHVEQARRGNLDLLGESLCIACDDLGIALDDVIEESEFTRLTYELAEAALTHGRSHRRRL